MDLILASEDRVVFGNRVRRNPVNPSFHRRVNLLQHRGTVNLLGANRPSSGAQKKNQAPSLEARSCPQTSSHAVDSHSNKRNKMYRIAHSQHRSRLYDTCRLTLIRSTSSTTSEIPSRR